MNAQGTVIATRVKTHRIEDAGAVIVRHKSVIILCLRNGSLEFLGQSGLCIFLSGIFVFVLDFTLLVIFFLVLLFGTADIRLGCIFIHTELLTAFPQSCTTMIFLMRFRLLLDFIPKVGAQTPNAQAFLGLGGFPRFQEPFAGLSDKIAGRCDHRNHGDD